jgi:ATP-dependent Lon protease
MSFLLDIPEQLPLLTAPDHVLFPQAMMPLFVVTASDLSLLDTCLNGDRILVFGCSNNFDNDDDNEQTLHYSLRTPHSDTATVALIRTCYRSSNNEALIILQGLGRVHIKEVFYDDLYPIALIEPLKTSYDATPHQLRTLKDKLHILLKQTPDLNDKILSILETVTNPQVFLDLAAYSVCNDTTMKMQLLETLSDKKRYELLIDYLRKPYKMSIRH